MSRQYVRRPFPADSLQEVIDLAQAIQDSNNGRPMHRVLLANAVGRKPASSQYKELLSSSFKYGLTLGTEKSEMIALTPLGTSLTKPRDAAERAAAVKQAAMEPGLFARLYQHYDSGKLPTGEFFLSVLERDFGVPRERCEECAKLVVDNARLAGIVREIQGTLYVILDPGENLSEAKDNQDDSALGDVDETSFEPSPPASPPPARTPTPPTAETPRQRYVFIGHGKNRKPLEQLEKVLKQLNIPYKVAIDEPQAARPISVKVADVMKECQSAVLIFTADEEFKDKDGNSIWRPSENVVYELGAASVLYENRIVIFKEEGVDFPANFHDIGHIPFDKDRLDVKGLELLGELVAFGVLKVQPA